MNQKLTTAIAGAYFGAEVTTKYQVNFNGTNSTYEHKSHMIGLHENGNLQFAHALKAQDYFHTKNCQLILASIVKITNEDAIFIYETIVGSANGEKYVVSKNKTDTNIESIWNCDRSDADKVTVYIPGSLEIYWNDGGEIREVDGVRMQTIIDYLRSKSYDCGHGSIPSLIAAGIAIEKVE